MKSTTSPCAGEEEKVKRVCLEIGKESVGGEGRRDSSRCPKSSGSKDAATDKPHVPSDGRGDAEDPIPHGVQPQPSPTGFVTNPNVLSVGMAIVDEEDSATHGVVPEPSLTGFAAAAAALGVGVALSAACAARSSSPNSTAESSGELSSLAAAAAEKRIVHAAGRGIGDTDKVSEMEAAAGSTANSGEEQFGERRRQQLRAELEKSRQQVAALASSKTEPTCNDNIREKVQEKVENPETHPLQINDNVRPQETDSSETNVQECASEVLHTLSTDMEERRRDTANTPQGVGDELTAQNLESGSASSALEIGAEQVQDVTSIAGTAAATVKCTPEAHVCGPCDVERGCPSCSRICHADCCDVLCSFTPCPYCTSRYLVTHESSQLCREAKMYNTGCHACGRLGCSTIEDDCHAKCTRLNHVCTYTQSDVRCTNCDKRCHTTNTDPRCPFFDRMRGHVTWTANAQQLLDTQAGTHGDSSHQLPWAFANYARTELEIDGANYSKGYGFPGDSSVGEFNNCLIDSLRQCLGDFHCDRRQVRSDLRTEFGNYVGSDAVTHTSYLDVELHWKAILRSLFRNNTDGRSVTVDLDDYCVVALDGDRPGHGVVLGNMHAMHRLVVINWGNVHFDPCLPR